MQQQTCCPKGSWPALKTNYVPRGEMMQIQGIPVYHVQPLSAKKQEKVIVITSDIFGAFSSRHQNVADTFADFGYSVYLPEILPQIYRPQTKQTVIEYIKRTKYADVEQRFIKLYEHLQKKGIKQFYGIGFCWGAWAIFTFAAKFQGFKALLAYHPSFGLYGEPNQLFNTIKCPGFLFPAKNDPPNIKQQGQMPKIMALRFGPENVGTKQFPQQMHGWVVRGDISQPNVHRDVELAIKLGKQYLSKH